VAELIAANVDVIVTAGTPAAFAVKNATSSIPCVMVAVGDPVGTGLVASLARPGGNLTGLTSIAPDLEGKRLALLREMIPTLSHFAVLWNPVNPFHVAAIDGVQAAAKALQMKMLSLGVRTSEELDGAFAAMVAERPGALVVLADRVFLHGRDRIMSFAKQQRLPGVYAYRELVEAGGLMSYGPNYAEMHASAATYVDKIFKGAKPADLPIEQPIKFELVINLKAAKALGIEVSPTLLATADELLE
jgi:putative ABC transport system substrate-binding protein